MNAKDEKQNRIAYQSWLIYRKTIIANVKHDKPYDDFINDRYYTSFMKLAKHIIDLNLDKPEEFVKFILKNSVRIDDWCKAVVYETYIKDRTKKETVERAIERSVLNMNTWAEKTGNSWYEYFAKVSTVDAVQDIRMGRISPWCNFATDQGSRLIDRFEPGQVQQLIEYIEPQSWRVKVKRQQQDADWVQEHFNKWGIL
jgi:D-ribose pyranose/furanose isomerase RbsD